jgi:hypothetical protein
LTLADILTSDRDPLSQDAARKLAGIFGRLINDLGGLQENSVRRSAIARLKRRRKLFTALGNQTRTQGKIKAGQFEGRRRRDTLGTSRKAEDAWCRMKNDPPGCRTNWQPARYDRAVVAGEIQKLACQPHERALAKALAARARHKSVFYARIDGEDIRTTPFRLTYRAYLAAALIAPGCAGARHLDKKTLAALKAVADQLPKQKPPPKKKPAPKTKAN